MRTMFLALVWLMVLGPYWAAIWFFPVLMDTQHWYSVVSELALVAGWAFFVAFSLAERLQLLLLHTEQDYYIPYIVTFFRNVCVVMMIGFLLSLVTPSDLIVSVSAGLFGAFATQYVARVC